MRPLFGCPKRGHPSSEVTGAICLVPSTSFSQAPWYALPVHLCRFGVRSIMWELFPGTTSQQAQSNKCSLYTQSVTTHRFRNINLIPIDYAFQPRLRSRLTLRRLTLHRNPWTFGESVFHTFCRYLCQHSRFRYLQQPLRVTFTGLRNAPLPRVQKYASASSVCSFSPGTSWAQDG